MLLRSFFWLQWFKFKRAVRFTKNSVSSATKKRSIAVKNKVRTAKITVSRAAKDQLLSFSKIRLPEPPFPRLLQSNTPPTDLEATDILKEISTVEAQALHLEEIIQEHGPDRMVEYQLDRGRQFVYAHRGILSVIRRIPPEVLQEIFCQTVLPWKNWDSIPWALSQVCQRWRTTALSITSLWSKLPTIYPHKKTSRSYITQIKELLVRSRDAPISFYLYAPSQDWESHPIIDVLIRHSDRWQAVFISSTSLTSFAFKGVKGRLSSLRTLSLQIWRHVDRVVFDMFEDAPQLHEVHLIGPFPGEVRLPFSQLTHYIECGRGRGMVDHTISLATSLTTLEIKRYSESPAIPVTTLPFLVTLKVHFYTFQRGFLDRLTLPIILEMWIAGYTPNLTDIVDLISRSHSPCTLKQFAFEHGSLDPGELTRLLRLTPELVALNLPLPPLDDLANLVIGRNSQPLAPLLQTLTIEAGDHAIHRPETNQLLNAIAASRCSLQDNLTPTVPYPPGDRHTLRELRIILNASTIYHNGLRYLEGWVPSEESAQLVMWREKLLQELPELRGLPPHQKRKLSDSKLRDRVFDIFSDIQKFHVKDVHDIYISGIHIILKRFMNKPVTSILSQFGDRAGEILEKWTPLFESHLQERRWVLKGVFSLVYLPIDDRWTLSMDCETTCSFPKYTGIPICFPITVLHLPSPEFMDTCY